MKIRILGAKIIGGTIILLSSCAPVLKPERSSSIPEDTVIPLSKMIAHPDDYLGAKVKVPVKYVGTGWGNYYKFDRDGYLPVRISEPSPVNTGDSFSETVYCLYVPMGKTDPLHGLKPGDTFTFKGGIAYNRYGMQKFISFISVEVVPNNP